MLDVLARTLFHATGHRNLPMDRTPPRRRDALPEPVETERSRLRPKFWI